MQLRASQVTLVAKNLPANAGDPRDVGSIPGQEDPLEEGSAAHSSKLVWRIPWTEEPGRLPQGWKELDTTEGTQQQHVQLKIKYIRVGVRNSSRPKFKDYSFRGLLSFLPGTLEAILHMATLTGFLEHTSRMNSGIKSA